MALSDSCFDFLESISEAARRLGKEAHHYSAPDYPIAYGPEIDSLRRAAGTVAEYPYDYEAGAQLLKLAATVGSYLDTPPGSASSDERRKKVAELVRILQAELSPEDAESMSAVLANVTSETPFTARAVARLKVMLPKLGKQSYDIAIRIIGDVASAAAKKLLGM